MISIPTGFCPQGQGLATASLRDCKDHAMRQYRLEKTLTCLWWVLLLILGSNQAQGQTAPEIAARAFRSTVLLVMEDGNGQPVSLGSGFFVREGEIVSNLHVVAGAARGYAKLVGEKAKYDIEGLTGVDSERDLVVLKVSAARPQALVLGNSDAVQVGEAVYAVPARA